MNKILLAILTLFCATAYGQETKDEFDGHAWQAPYTFPTPKDWGVERFLVPPSFAPSISYKGVEDIRFAPGWAKSGSDEYWSYAFLWYLEGKPVVTAATLEEDLKAYYTGLIEVNSDSARLAAWQSILVTTKFTSNHSSGTPSFTGTVTMMDYMTGKPITLHCRVRARSCNEPGKEFVFFELSPQPYTHSIWKSLDQLWQDFDCKK
ncbi:MAG: hypothetical protein ABL895_18980 [Cyclobacteriaceae bacterium]